MCRHSTTSLGFTDEKVPVGTHICIIYTDEEERRNSLFRFLASGLQEKERIACFSDGIDEAELALYLAEHAISYDACRKENTISVSGTDDVYFQNGEFAPDIMLNRLSRFYYESKGLGFAAARVIGDMAPKVQSVPGGERLLEYESRVTMLLRQQQVTCVCQYDANAFDGAAILEIMKVHPKMVVNGRVVNNPFFIAPEVYLHAKS